jgi:hypothetical protein
MIYTADKGVDKKRERFQNALILGVPVLAASTIAAVSLFMSHSGRPRPFDSPQYTSYSSLPPPPENTSSSTGSGNSSSSGSESSSARDSSQSVPAEQRQLTSTPNSETAPIPQASTPNVDEGFGGPDASSDPGLLPATTCSPPIDVQAEDKPILKAEESCITVN